MTDKTGCEALAAALAAEPANLALAWRYWRALGCDRGDDGRSGWAVVRAFGAAALASADGALAFARAYHELFALSGETPRLAYVGRDLRQALRRAAWVCYGADRRLVKWVLACVLAGRTPG